jgi:hypothetical protein
MIVQRGSARFLVEVVEVFDYLHEKAKTAKQSSQYYTTLTVLFTAKNTCVYHIRGAIILFCMA